MSGVKKIYKKVKKSIKKLLFYQIAIMMIIIAILIFLTASGAGIKSLRTRHTPNIPILTIVDDFNIEINP